jgi:hypothetical protein
LIEAHCTRRLALPTRNSAASISAVNVALGLGCGAVVLGGGAVAVAGVAEIAGAAWVAIIVS